MPALHYIQKKMSLSLRGAVMLTSVAMVAATGAVMLFLSTSTADYAIDEMVELNDESIEQCFKAGTESLESLAAILVTNVNTEIGNILREELRILEFSGTFIAKQCSIGPPPDVSETEWLGDSLAKLLVHLIGYDISSYRVGIIMPSPTDDPFEIATRDFVWYANNPLALQLESKQRIMALMQRINGTELMGTPDNTGRISPDYPCDIEKLQRDATPPGSGPCRVSPLYGTLALSKIDWLTRILGTHEPLHPHWNTMGDLPTLQVSLSVAMPWVLNGKRGAVFASISFHAISRLFHKAAKRYPAGIRVYGFIRDDVGYFLVGVSHGESVHTVTHRAEELGFGPYAGNITSQGKMYVQEATDSVIQEHGKAVSKLQLLILNSTFTTKNNVEYLCNLQHVADGQGEVINIVVLLPRSVALESHNRETEAARASIVRNKELTEDKRATSLQAMISVACVAGIIMSLASAALSLKITRSLRNLAKHMSAVAAMDLERVERGITESRFTEVRKMQVAFLQMVDNLRVYKSYMPPAVFAKRSAVTPTSSAPDEPTQHVNPTDPNPLSPTLIGTPLEIQAIIGPNTYSPNEEEEEEKHPLEHLIHMGTRVRKGSILSVTCSDTIMDDIPVFLTTALDAIRRHNGLILSFTAHRVIATWNVHQSVVRHAAAASDCALDLSSRLQATPHLPNWGMAVDTGLVRCGTAGDNLTRSLVCVGGPVNFANKVSQLARQLGARILASEEVVDRVRKHIEARVVDVVPTVPYPKSDSLSFVYELKGFIYDEGTDSYASYTNGFSAFTQGEYAQAKRLLTSHLQLRQDDYQAKRLLKLALQEELHGRKSVKYVRNYSGWEPLETTDGMELPDGLEETFANDTLRMNSTYVETDPSNNDADNLEKEIKHALANPASGRDKVVMNDPMPIIKAPAHDTFETITTNTARSGASVARTKELTSTMMTLTMQWEGDAGNFDAPAKEFTDRTGVLWNRSERVLGKGAYGCVWLGMCDTGELCALKTLPLEGPDHSSKEVDTLINEVRVLSGLRDDHLVSYITSVVAGRHVFIAMELMPGGSVAGLLQTFCTLPPSATVRYTKDMLKGLRFLHTKGIIHRDLKPANVLLQLDGTCKLADFGASERFGFAGKKGKINGTPLYMSPDACTGAGTEASDIWALGITVAEMLTGEVPYPKTLRKQEPLVFIYQMVSGRIKPAIPDKSPRSSEFLKSCLATDPQQRPSADNLLTHPFLLSG
eukprot:TRINITY_DN17212_c0_g1_i1.p1 TRINITY_DN17212_c0_g1~~TRINITY_DN17212_c0_g1_i1.p1  ORF type:complete len:1233 (+),score=201.81 TRINITY_DN17212_c0_g1_i1:110-3808(+)